MPASNRVPVSAVLIVQLLIVVVGALFAAAWGNTLAAHPEWVSTKETLGMRVMGARMFATTRETLASDRLDLGRWHGFQEVLYREPLSPIEISFDFRLADEAWLAFIFGKTEDAFSGLRLSRHERFPSSWFAAAPDGEFTAMAPVDTPALSDGWMRLRVSFDALGAQAWLDDRPLGRFTHPLPARHRFGFRSGQHSVLIDDVAVRERERGAMLRESFSNGRGFWQLVSAGIAAIAIVNGGGFWLARRRNAGPRLAFASLTAALTSLACILVLFAAYRAFLAKAYPRVNTEQEAAFKEQEVRDIGRRLHERHAPRPPPSTIRVLFLGTSQTWGAGARWPDDAFPAVLERRLNAAATDGWRFECINAGVSGLESSRLLELYAKDWIDLAPDIVVANLASNDGDARALQDSLVRLIRTNRSRGILTLFSLEPNSLEYHPGPLPMHAPMQNVAFRNLVPIADVHRYLREHSTRGFAWWDFVHPTSFGHRLIAEALEPKLLQLARKVREQAESNDPGT